MSILTSTLDLILCVLLLLIARLRKTTVLIRELPTVPLVRKHGTANLFESPRSRIRCAYLFYPPQFE